MITRHSRSAPSNVKHCVTVRLVTSEPRKIQQLGVLWLLLNLQSVNSSKLITFTDFSLKVSGGISCHISMVHEQK